jgi:redox-sensitive bicupin YhaK (pirin superfamily)
VASVSIWAWRKNPTQAQRLKAFKDLKSLKAKTGHFNFGWLETYHSFSFGDYYDPNYMGFKTLRVINEDRIEPGQGFPTHAHKDMEILSYVLEGELEHKDSLGNGSRIKPGDVQRMSAGTGVQHSEYNPSGTQKGHFLQIWILPEIKGRPPSYEQKTFNSDEKRGRLCLVASPDGRNGSVVIGQDVLVYAAILNAGEKLAYVLSENRGVWLQVARGTVILNGQILNTSDGAQVEDESHLEISASETSEFLLFDLA